MADGQLSHCKLCELADFSDPGLRELIRDVFISDLSSSSSIEHFGDFPDVRRSVEEMFRVLRPGGILALATEFRVTAVERSEAFADQESGKRGWSRYPQLVIRHEQFLWTSVHVALVKSGLTAAEWRRRAPELPPRVRERLARRAYPAVAWGRRRLSRGS